ncbi:MAG: helix-turn-helix domain-containing protein [Clostridia bacterium]|nr:helix-turn-helix domain-containing protein [Clostridia bacterium]
MDVAKILKALRVESGLTQKELSDRLKIGQATIACYENGQREPQLTSLIAYADYFECSLDYLSGRTDDFGNVIIGAERTKHGVNTLTDEENALLTKFRKMNAADRTKLFGYVDGLSDK